MKDSTWFLWMSIVMCIDFILFIGHSTTGSNIGDIIFGLSLAILIILFCKWNFSEKNCQIPAVDFNNKITDKYILEDKIDITNYPII